MKIYCEHGAITKRLRELQQAGMVELIHFPYDPNSRSKHLTVSAIPSKAQWRDMNIKWNEANFAFSDMQPSEHFEAIQQLVGVQNRRDTLHVDSAFKSKCKAFLTKDQDILSQRNQLEALLGIRFFHPEQDATELDKFIFGK